MAVVGKSAHVHDIICKKIDKLFENRLLEARKDYNGIPEKEIGERAYKVMFGPIEDAFSAVVKYKAFFPFIGDGTPYHTYPSWCRQSESIAFIYKNNMCVFPLRTPHMIPNDMTHTSYHGKANITLFDGHEVVTTVLDHMLDAVAKVTSQKEEFLNEFERLWDSVASVNQLAVIWPQVLTLLEGETMWNSNEVITERLAAKVERRTVKKVKLEVDTRALSTQFVMAQVAK